MNNPTKKLSEIRQKITKEIEGGLSEPIAAERLLHLSREIRNVAIHVFAKEIFDAIPSKVTSITWSGWYGEDENGAPGHYVDGIELIFMVNGMAYELPVYRDFFDFDAAPLALIAYLSDMPVANIQDAEAALFRLNEEKDPILSIKPAAIEEFCTLAFIHSNIEEWAFRS